MTTDETRRAKELFLDALELDGSEREAFLDGVRRESPGLCSRVERLLGAHAGADDARIDEVFDVVELLRRHRSAEGAAFGDYELLEEVAAGSSGAVWRARQRSLDRVVALKVLRAGKLASAREVELFHAEAGAIAQLDHPHIVPVYEVGEYEGRPYFSMKWIEGGSLAERTGAPTDPREAARLVATVSLAVHHAHQRGLLHRDIKPSNVLIDEEGEPHVADFGIAKRIDASRTATDTRLAGTPAYMAPEQAAGGELTVATDVWALGCVLYELLCGQPPFRGPSITRLLAEICDREPARPRERNPLVPRDLETIALRCLQKEPERRYPSANALAEDLERWLEHRPIVARRATPLERLQLYWRRSPVVASLAALVGLLVVALAVGASWTVVTLRASLRDSWLETARATRLSGAPGRRAAGLELVARAARIRPGEDLRDEAIACLALTDLDPERSWPLPGGGASGMVFGPRLERWAWIDDQGGVHVGTLGSDAERLYLPDPVPARGLRFSRDGRLLAVKHFHDGPFDPHFRVWDVERGTKLLDVPASVGFDAFDVSPGLGLAALGTPDRRLLVYDLSTGELVREVELAGRLGSLRFHPERELLAISVGGGVDVLEVWALPDWQLEHSFDLSGSTFMLEWEGSGDALVTACADFNGYVWDLGRADPRVRLVGHRGEVVKVITSPTAKLAATYSWEGIARLWDTDTGDELASFSAWIGAFSADGARISLRRNDAIETRLVRHGGVLRTLYGHDDKNPRHLAFSPDSARLVSAGGDETLVWDAATGRRLGRLDFIDGKRALFAPDGRSFLVAGVPDGRGRRGGLHRVDASDLTRRELLADGTFEDAAQSADGSVIALQQGRDVRLLFPSGGESRVLPGYDGLTRLKVSPDGRWVIAGSWQGRGARVWDAATGAVVASLLPEVLGVTVDVSPDGRWLATGVGDSYVLWELGTWTRARTIPREVPLTTGGAPLAFSPDGRHLAVVHRTETVGIVEVETGRIASILEAPEPQPINHLTFSPDGTMLAVACSTNRIQLWDLARLAEELAELGLEE